MRKKISVLFLTLFLLGAQTGKASVGDAASWTGGSSVDFVKDLGSAGADVLKVAAGAAWIVSEIIIYPFRIFLIEEKVSE